uniref:B30.2/SPRY domain-containing protein n=1 Tax=Globodera rostochiensis TaxID=31243 RepID=A0A914HP09_GLORO
MPLNRLFGLHKDTFAYASYGDFWANGHSVTGTKPSFRVTNVIGCGLNLATRQIIYTKNGERLDTANLFADSAADLFPCISLVMPGTKIEANFGPNFQFNISDEI